jgi:hypothetical protein
MEEEPRNDDGNAEIESDSERRRRRRRHRRRKKKKTEGMSDETVQLLRLARWGVGGLVMLATWAYGVYVADKLGWGALIFFPAGLAAMVCISYALAIPFVTFLIVVVAFLMKIDGGPLAGLRFAGMAFAGVGALYAVFRFFVFMIVKREVTRNEAGYK